MLLVRWHGHSCFELTDSQTTVITDPHDGDSLNLPPPPKTADAVTISHDHQDHISDANKYTCPILKEPIQETIGTAYLKGVECWHDDQRGKRLGPNIAWNIILNGIQITHLGDLGHFLKTTQMSQIGSPEILIVNTGTDTVLADNNIALLSPRVIIPMHYHTPGIDFPFYPLKTLQDFMEGKDNVEHIGTIHTYTREEIPHRPVIHVYDAPRKQK